MKAFKKAVVALITAMVMVMGLSVVSFAAQSPAKTNIATATATTKSVKYNGKKQSPVVKVKAADGTKLKEGVDYIVEFDSAKHSGDYTVVIRGIGRYEGTTTATFTIEGTASAADNRVTATTNKSTSYKAKDLKKKNKKITVTVSKSKKNKGAVTYKVVSKDNKKALKYVSVDENGVIKLKKGIKKGTYKVRIKIAGYKKYAPQKKTIKIVIR